MKLKIFLLALITCAMISCDDQDSDKNVGAENVDIIKSMYEAFRNQDVEAVLGAMSDSIYWNEAENFVYADMNPYVGPKAVAEGVFQRIGQEWEYWKLEQIELASVEDDRVLATGRYMAKNKASGKTLDAQFAHLWTLKDGKAVGFQQFTDTKQAADVIVIEAEEPEEDNGLLE